MVEKCCYNENLTVFFLGRKDEDKRTNDGAYFKTHDDELLVGSIDSLFICKRISCLIV
jgi:hypothetical protein